MLTWKPTTAGCYRTTSDLTAAEYEAVKDYPGCWMIHLLTAPPITLSSAASLSGAMDRAEAFDDAVNIIRNCPAQRRLRSWLFDPPPPKTSSQSGQ